MIEVKSPAKYDKPVTIFVGGSIEMGAAENWQEKFAAELAEFNVMLLNPRRDDWNPRWEQSLHNDKFYEQVSWELRAQEEADFCVYYFDPATSSPITLLELGLFKDKAIVCCPDDYFRQGNVLITCNHYSVPAVKTWSEFIHLVKYRIKYRRVPS